MKTVKNVTEFFEQNKRWQQELLLLRDIIQSTEMEETVKWDIPVYTIEGKNIVGIGSFKSYFGLWFYQGALLDDAEKVLYNAQEGVTKALRQWRFKSMEEIDHDIIYKYLLEAIDNQKAGKFIKPEKKVMPDIPDILSRLFKTDPLLEEQFKLNTPFKQREYIEYIIKAKKEETKQRRVNRIAALLRDGSGLNDRYR